MKAIRKVYLDLDEFEQILARGLERVAAELEPLPQDRDAEKLEVSWRQATSSRRKLSIFLKDSLRQINARTETTGVTARHLRLARKKLNAAQTRLRLWGRFEAIVLAQLASSSRDLVEVDIAPRRDTDVMDQVVAMFIDAMHKIANPTAHTQGDDANTHGCHRDIPLPMSRFTKMIGAAHRICLAQRRERPLRFLDVGSGGGTKVLAATTCFDICDGLEYEQSTVETGSKLLELLAPNQCRLIHGDALEFTDYENYDVIYFYRPLVGFDKMVAMEERILSQVRPGTVLLVAGGLFSTDLDSKNVHQLVDQIYVTGVSKSEATVLKGTAQRMGSMVTGYGRRNYARLNYWAPLYEVSIRNGYFI